MHQCTCVHIGTCCAAQLPLCACERHAPTSEGYCARAPAVGGAGPKQGSGCWRRGCAQHCRRRACNHCLSWSLLCFQCACAQILVKMWLSVPCCRSVSQPPTSKPTAGWFATRRFYALTSLGHQRVQQLQAILTREAVLYKTLSLKEKD